MNELFRIARERNVEIRIEYEGSHLALYIITLIKGNYRIRNAITTEYELSYAMKDFEAFLNKMLDELDSYIERNKHE